MNYAIRNGSRYLFALYLLSAVILVFSAMVLRREYQDAWVLEDLFVQTLLLSLTFSFLVVNIRGNTKIAFLIASFLSILSAIPNLKYTQIYGVFDPIAHYGYINRLISLGRVPEIGFYSNEYSGTPSMSLLLATISLVTGLSTTITIKLFLVVISSMSPFFIYLAIKNAFSEKIKKFLLLALCFSLPTFYILTGRTYGLIMYLFFTVVFLRQITVKQPSRQFFLVLIILGINLIISHGYTSLFLSMLMFFTFFLLNFFWLIRARNAALEFSRYLHVSFFLLVTLMAWWMYNARYLFNKFLVGIFKSLFSVGSTTLISSKFYQLSLHEQLTLVYVRFYDTLTIIFLSLIGLAFYLTTFRKQVFKRTRTLYLNILCIISAASLIAVPFISKFQVYTIEERFINYLMLLSPFFVGLSLYSLNRYWRRRIKRANVRNFLSALLLFSVLLSLFLSKFTYQPLLPRNEENEYIVDYRSVNTVYQIQMIKFAERHHVNRSKFSSDDVTAWQIFGLTGVSFHSCYTWHNPLYENNTESDMILLHYPGISGPLNEPLEYRTKMRLNEFKFKLGNNVIYDNSESFIIVIINQVTQ